MPKTAYEFSLFPSEKNLPADFIARCEEFAALCASPRSAAVMMLLVDEGRGMWGRETKFSEGARVHQFELRLPEVMTKAPRDREIIRDYLIRPLRGIGAVECVTYTQVGFIEGHHPAKNSNCAYRITADAWYLLHLPEAEYRAAMDGWIAASRTRKVTAIKMPASDLAKASTPKSKHSNLIVASSKLMTTYHLPGFRLVHIDDGDGDRVTPAQEQALKVIGLDLTLDDAYPDAILFDDENNAIWFVEAVTSDGEVDEVKHRQFATMCARWGKVYAGATTVYETYEVMTRRRAKGARLAMDTTVLVAEEPGILHHRRSAIAA